MQLIYILIKYVSNIELQLKEKVTNLKYFLGT